MSGPGSHAKGSRRLASILRQSLTNNLVLEPGSALEWRSKGAVPCCMAARRRPAAAVTHYHSSTICATCSVHSMQLKRVCSALHVVSLHLQAIWMVALCVEFLVLHKNIYLRITPYKMGADQVITVHGFLCICCTAGRGCSLVPHSL